jgi:16S rRNA (cytosine1402-N4)-methyltransferase
MLQETIEGLNLRKGLIYVDATAGGGGHSFEIAKAIHPEGKLIAIDADVVAIDVLKEKLREFQDSVTIVNANYSAIPKILSDLNIDEISGGILFDLGASYYQLTSKERGFSFMKEAPLDMRFDSNAELTAYDVVNSYSKTDLERILKEYGEERFYRKIASAIIEKRRKSPIKTTTELATIAKTAYYPKRFKIHPATRMFQAFRIEVNNELENFKNTFKEVIPLLSKNARIVAISFHSLEDRLVKNTFKYYSFKYGDLTGNEATIVQGKYIDNVCLSTNSKSFQSKSKADERDFFNEARLEIITKKPLTASLEEIKQNPPSRCAKLRVARKI